jgi:hypothetical protein
MRVDCGKREVGTLRWSRSRKMELRGATTIAEAGPARSETGRRECSSESSRRSTLLTAGVVTARRGGGASDFDVPSSRGRWQVPPTEWKEEGCDEQSSP